MEGGGDEEVMYDPHFSSVGSLEETIFDFHSGDPAPLDSNEFPHPPITDSTVLTGELRDKIIKQVEYYLSDEKLKTDKFLLKFLAKDGEGYISIAVIASFKKMKTLTHHKSLVVAALKESSFLTLSSNEKKIKRVRSLPLTEVLDPQLYTVLVENLPEDHSIENMKKIFGIYENATREARKCSINEKLLSGKVIIILVSVCNCVRLWNTRLLRLLRMPLLL